MMTARYANHICAKYGFSLGRRFGLDRKCKVYTLYLPYITHSYLLISTYSSILYISLWDNY